MMTTYSLYPVLEEKECDEVFYISNPRNINQECCYLIAPCALVGCCFLAILGIADCLTCSIFQNDDDSTVATHPGDFN